MSHLVANPPWVTRAIAASFETMEDNVPPAWLPKLSKTKASGVQLVGAIKEYGCGAYGCALPTLDPGTVLKVTTDDTEAEFAAQISSTLKYPVVVEYRMVMQLATKHEGRAIYLLWRESAEEVGGLDKDEQAFELISPQHAAAQVAYIAMYHKGAVTNTAIEKWRQSVIAMRKDPRLNYLADGLLEIFDGQGVFLGDIHPGNLGKCLRDGEKRWVVTDPGHVSVVAR